jgi:hypothetical protein
MLWRIWADCILKLLIGQNIIISISVLNNVSHGVVHRWWQNCQHYAPVALYSLETLFFYPWHIATPRSTLIASPYETYIRRSLIQGALSSQRSSRNQVVKYGAEPYCVVTLHQASITFSAKIIHCLKFYQRAFQLNILRGITLFETISSNILTVLAQYIKLQLP